MPSRIAIRDLETGEVSSPFAASAVEILRQKDRFVREGQEPKGWKDPRKAKADKGD